MRARGLQRLCRLGPLTRRIRSVAFREFRGFPLRSLRLRGDDFYRDHQTLKPLDGKFWFESKVFMALHFPRYGPPSLH